MKRKIIVLTIAVVVVFGLCAILIQNKETMNNRIVKDDVSSYPVTVDNIKSMNVNRQARFVGTTEAYNDIELLSETQGRVLEVKTENGMHISKGTLLAQVDDELLRANYKLAESSFEKTKKDNERYEALYKEGNVSINDLENVRISLKNAEAQYIIARRYLENAKIISPINGVIARRYINTGSTLAPGSPIANIVDISKLKVKVSVPESEIKSITKNHTVKLTTETYPGKTFEGKVISVGVKADDSHNYPVEILLVNSNNEFNAGMYLEAVFEFKGSENLPVIPRNALVGSIKNPQVYVAQNGKALLKDIIISRIEGNTVLVKSGLNAGEQIIIGGRNNLENGVAITIKNN